MSDTLTLYISHYGSDFTWLFRRDNLPDQLGAGDIEDLAGALGAGNHQARLIIGGPQTVSRQLQYVEKEKRHLRKLMPFQLEDEVVGDIDQFHFAFGTPSEGQVSLVYTEQAPFRELFEALASINVEVIQALPAALMPSATNTDSLTENTTAESTTADPATQADSWAVHWQDGLVSVRFGKSSGFTLQASNARVALELLLRAENRVDLPKLQLSAPDENQLEQLKAVLPASLNEANGGSHICSLWDYEPDAHAIDLCQGDFSQRLPIERWWKLWSKITYVGLAAVAVYLVTLLLSIHQLQTDNLEIRRDIEQVFRTVVPHGPAVDPERRLRIMARELEPATGGSQVIALLAEVLPAVQTGGVTLKGVYYTSENGELSLNVQASSFNAIESLRSTLASPGQTAELLSVSAQGDTHSARIKVTRERP